MFMSICCVRLFVVSLILGSCGCDHLAALTRWCTLHAFNQPLSLCEVEILHGFGSKLLYLAQCIILKLVKQLTCW